MDHEKEISENVAPYKTVTCSHFWIQKALCNKKILGPQNQQLAGIEEHALQLCSRGFGSASVCVIHSLRVGRMKVGRTQCHKRFLGSFRLHRPNTSGLRDTWSAQTGKMKSFKEDQRL